MEAANATAHCCAECGIAGGDQDMRVVFSRQILQSYVSKESLVDAQNRMQTTDRRATGRGSVQGPARQGGLPNLLSTYAGKIVILYLTSSSDNIVCTNKRICNCSCGVG